VPVWQNLQVRVQPTWLRAAVFLGDVDRLDLLAVGEAQQPLAGAVLGHLGDGDLRPAHHVGLRQAGAEVLGEIGHLREVGDPAVVDPVPQLLGPEGLLAQGGQFRRQLVARQPDEVAFLVAGVAPGFRGRGEDVGVPAHSALDRTPEGLKPAESGVHHCRAPSTCGASRGPQTAFYWPQAWLIAW